MLETDEFALLQQARMLGMAVVEEEARRRNQLLKPAQPQGIRERHQQPLLEMYKLLTDFEETNPNAIWHHIVDQYGPPCPQCHKPLRTPQARFCAACGYGQAGVTADSLPLVPRRSELFRGG
ncbi:MAG: zinc ribbon domain-containing protein [Bacteroidota bacterium]|nr:zinc ribbon domain-containing protein [Bacteroidota bacterium]